MQPSKRAALLDTAERLFYTEGFHATGIDRVVAEAGVARMTLYNHFPSKEALIEAVLECRYRRYLDDLRNSAQHAAPGSAVMALAERHGEWLSSVADRGCIVLKAIGEFDRHSPRIAALGRTLKRDLLASIEQALAADGLSGDAGLAERILLVLEGADALVPVLGAETAISHLGQLIADVLADMPRATP